MTRLLPLATVIAALSACIPQDPDAERFASVLPDDRLLIDLPSAGGTARTVGELSEYYVLTAQVTGDVNDLIGGVLILVDYVTDFTPSWADETHQKATWGPWDDGPLDPNHTLLWVEQHEDGSYTWAFAQRDKDAADDVEWTPIIAGEVDAGTTETTGSGRFAIDFDALSAMNPIERAEGLFVSEYDIQGEHVIASAMLQDFSEDGSEPPADASYAYEQAAGGDGLMDLGIVGDTNHNGTDETIVIRSRWTQDGAGRSDAYLTGGDLGPFVFTATECWDEAFENVYHVDNYSFTNEGDVSRCAFADADYHPDEPEV